MLVTVEYDVDPERAPGFVRAMQAVGTVRRRNGSREWSLYRDPASPRRFMETFVADTWAEHLRQHERLTMADRAVEEEALAFHQGGGRPPEVSHFINAGDGLPPAG